MGPVRFADYSGYKQTLKFVPYKPVLTTAKDGMGRALTEITGFDAVDFSKTCASIQFGSRWIRREYFKAQSAFVIYPNTNPKVPVATRPWGAGAFKGDQALKVVIQWLAACSVKREIIFTKTPSSDGT
ncbi:poly(ADP-ribose) glycohydrolase [Plakobranchus ocellatus]|uniref:Poly(ADP-ribose) glycohydrolase n=1 Tax=Plakobranchus ocellatus TaxID=259542 RepID=A0AAV4CNX1_9GAST|nr:poly(ADP-ribose) glycohydrolase [Plakobranchus ocellatus]